MFKKKSISAGSIVKVLDLEHGCGGQCSGISVYGKVFSIRDGVAQLGISPYLNLGTFIDRNISLLELSDISSVPLKQVEGLGYRLKSVLPEEVRSHY